MSNATELTDFTDREYEYGFVTEIESETIPKGLSEEIVRIISAKKEEPQWLLQWRLKAYHRFAKMLEEGHEPSWAMITYPAIDYQDMYYYSAPKKKDQLESLDDVDLSVWGFIVGVLYRAAEHMVNLGNFSARLSSDS